MLLKLLCEIPSFRRVLLETFLLAIATALAEKSIEKLADRFVTTSETEDT